jgi:4'-phosphopantetheinyl transferase EntD
MKPGGNKILPEQCDLMTIDTEPFITGLQRFKRIKAIESSGLIIYRCGFGVKHYHDRFFRLLQIERPASLERAVDKRKAEFLSGRLCAKHGLAELGVNGFVIGSDKNHCPLWPRGITGSISHSQSIALAMLTSSAGVVGVGIDIESIISTKTMNDTKGMILHGNDEQWLRQTDGSPEMVFSLIFSIKESFFKAAYPSTGYYFDFDAVTIKRLDFDQQRFTLTLQQNLNPKLTAGLCFSGHFCFVDGQVLSLLVIRHTARS